jgi:hypothetical protein
MKIDFVKLKGKTASFKELINNKSLLAFAFNLLA